MASSDSRPVCKYGSACYRRNPQHLEQYSHPHVVNDGGNNIDLRKYKNAPCEVDIVKKRVREDEIHEDEKYPTPTPKKTRSNSFIQMEKITTKNSDSDVEDSDDMRDNIRKKFLIDMSEDFYQFWDFCCSLSPEDPLNALHSTLQLVLVGPYDVLAGKLKRATWHNCVLHCRYYYDPPELTTVLMRKGSEDDDFHIGYFRDDPNAITDGFMVANRKGCVLTHEGLNIFAAVRYDIQEKLSSKKISLKLKKDLQSLEESLVKRAEEFDLNLKDKKPHQRKVVAKCFNQIGISVPLDTALDIGYRPLPMTNKELQKLLDKISLCQDESKHALTSEPLEEMITLVQFANDECDYGMGLELGMNLFCHGSDRFHNHILHILSLAYELLGREEYGKIIQKHLKNRSIIPLDLCRDVNK